MAAERTRGSCAYCGRELTRSGMARHLAGCPKRAAAIAAADAGPGEARPIIHLEARDSWGGEFWLQLEMDGNATMEDLDEYLRAIWLECCGHMSRFTPKGWGSDEIGMGRKASAVLRPGVELVHMYDFGDTTETPIRVVGLRNGKPTTKHPVALMARNAALAEPCQECGAPGTLLCMECAAEGLPGVLCAEHGGEDHPHYEEEEAFPMPLVNSPRAGVCGYGGPAEPPY